MCRTLQGHGHWVNVLALNTDYVMRTGAFDPATATIVPQENSLSPEQLQNKSLERYKTVTVRSFFVCFNKGYDAWLLPTAPMQYAAIACRLLEKLRDHV